MPAPYSTTAMKLVARPLYNAISVAFIFGFAMLHARVLAPVKYDLLSWPGLVWWAVLAMAQMMLGYALGLPELVTSRSAAAWRGLFSVIAAFGVISAFQALLATPLLPRSSSLLVGVVLPIWTVVSWNLSRDANARAATRDRVFLVVDRVEDRESLIRDLGKLPEWPATVVGSMSLSEVEEAGTVPLVLEKAEEAGASILVVDTAGQAYGPLVEQAAELHRRGVRVRTLALFYEEWIGKLPHSELARVSLLFDVGEIHRARYVRAKRLADLCFATIGLVGLAPVALGVAILNPVLNRGPLVYRQPRVGKDGVEFTIYKLRTMVPSDGETVWTAQDDDRITRLGSILRRTHLDELPQIFNIFKGDLSLVGPRPEQPQYVSELADKIAFYEMRHIVRPGLTGWAQVKQGYAADHGDAFDKLQYDFYYLRRQGVALDARIVWRTLRGVVGGDGR